jgi:hypothetical protein
LIKTNVLPATSAAEVARCTTELGAHEIWTEFLKQYERFTDLLCLAAKQGCTEDVEVEYRLLRQWFVRRYNRVANILKPYLTHLPTLKYVKAGRRSNKQSRMRHLDSIHALFYWSSLGKILETDNGDLIAQVSRISEAVYGCDIDQRRLNNS